MLAVLPKQNTDEVGGELFVEAYSRHLAGYPNEAISYLASEATGTRKWFPTIAECIEILSHWHRNDEAVHRRHRAKSLAYRERDARRVDDVPEPLPPMRQEQVDTLPESLRTMGLKLGYLERDNDGNVKPAA